MTYVADNLKANTKTVFMEEYGYVPVYIQQLIKKFDVSPSDFDLMFIAYPDFSWDDVSVFIENNSTRGYFQYPFGF